ncbi:Fcf2 pre-rRNA processing [Artemisia annua]|uniref:Fcf2 pre-rRNA processing n=1 Tax=Artemisia annua TaxID=35608 RepID=A0A2U1M963_ARTAN|nr:Fcf2 pre-rRNA processing [Artemisia annua]
MLEDKNRIGLSWEPQVSSLLFGTKSGSNDKSKSVPESSLVYKPNSELIDGLFVPPNDPKKVNKILKKQVKDTAGKSWFDMPAPTLTPELKKDLQLLKVNTAFDGRWKELGNLIARKNTSLMLISPKCARWIETGYDEQLFVSASTRKEYGFSDAGRAELSLDTGI